MPGPSLPTGAMRQLDDQRRPRDAGLVLLYAEEFEQLPAAWALPREGAAVIGRDPTAHLCLPVSAVSRRHAEVRHERGRWILRDLGSTNGVFVEGQRIEQYELEPTVEVRIGDAFLKFVEEDVAAYRDFRIDGAMLGGAARRTQGGTELLGGWQMDHIAAELERAATSLLSVLLLGESGTGKEVAARELHQKSGRRGAFVAVNCAAIPANLIESELFGYKRGAFSGAERDRPGLIKSAHEGTLLFDEIGDMPLEAQAKLLRVIQAREVLPLGSSTPERVDVRFVCATHRDLAKLLAQQRFREDLYARLAEHSVRLPPLRDRKEDLLQLTRAFIAREGKAGVVPSFEYVLGLLAYDWPYNVRELMACVKRSLVFTDGPALGPESLPEAVQEAARAFRDPARASRPAEGPSAEGPVRPSPPSREELLALLGEHKGNVAAVGREFGKARMQVHRWMKQYDILVDDFR